MFMRSFGGVVRVLILSTVMFGGISQNLSATSYLAQISKWVSSHMPKSIFSPSKMGEEYIVTPVKKIVRYYPDDDFSSACQVTRYIEEEYFFKLNECEALYTKDSGQVILTGPQKKELVRRVKHYFQNLNYTEQIKFLKSLQFSMLGNESDQELNYYRFYYDHLAYLCFLDREDQEYFEDSCSKEFSQ